MGMNQFNTLILKVWAVLLVVALLVMGSVPVFTFGAVCYGFLGVLWLRDRRQGRDAPLMQGAMLLLCIVWFALNTFMELALRVPGWGDQRLMAVVLAVAFLFPPLIIHAYYEEQGRKFYSSRPWTSVLSLLWAVSLTAAVYIVLLLLERVPYWGDETWWVLSLLLFALFSIVAIVCGIVLSREEAEEKARARIADRKQQRLWNYVLLGLMVLLFTLAILDISVWNSGGMGGIVSYLSRSLPLFFFFVNAYYESRFEFFDVFVKKSTLFFLTLILLFAYFSWVAPVFSDPAFEGTRPWLLALSLLPLFLALPWLFRRIEAWMDEAWLGRHFTTQEAVQFFLAQMQKATSERELVEKAEEGLSQIFQAPVHIYLTLSGRQKESDFERREEIEIPSYGHLGGKIIMGERQNRTPYFSQDLTMLSACAEVFSYMLENIRLQNKKQEQEKREQELILHASRSELKALRAQINPHFLFNALNAIASLISINPQRAEETVEELSEVFRYSLSRSEKEWVKVADEMDFIRSYLEVEKARFGKRLQIKMEVDPTLRDVLIPTMVVQTLVENAVKHGVASVKGVGRIEIEVFRAGSRMEITVADNGHGLSEKSRPLSLKEGKKGSGYGLKNIQRRLEGYYGKESEFTLTRDRQREMTVASIRVPVTPPVTREASL